MNLIVVVRCHVLFGTTLAKFIFIININSKKNKSNRKMFHVSPHYPIPTFSFYFIFCYFNIYIYKTKNKTICLL